MLGWLGIGLLCMIWAGLLLPRARGILSPRASVEEFERKMTLLAETNREIPGRWVLMPRKGERIMGLRERTRVRIRQRRRQVLTVLLEAAVLTAIMGAFPPFRPMLYGTAILGGVILVYLALLMRLRALESRRARERRLRARESRIRAERARALVPTVPAPVMTERDFLRESGVRIIEGDVHVIIRPGDEVEERREALADRRVAVSR